MDMYIHMYESMLPCMYVGDIHEYGYMNIGRDVCMHVCVYVGRHVWDMCMHVNSKY